MESKNKTRLFLVLVFGISFLAAGLFYLFGGRLDRTGGAVFAVLYMFFPLISALIVEKLIYREKIQKPLLISFRLNRWFLISWLLPPLIIFGSLGISLLFPGISWSPGMEGMFERYEDMMTIMTILFSPLFLYITIKTGSVIAASVMHGTLNGTAGLSIMMIAGGNELTTGITGLAGFLSIILFTVLFYLYDSLISREKIMTGTINRFLKE